MGRRKGVREKGEGEGRKMGGGRREKENPCTPANIGTELWN